ncbi:MAG TPA: hypothetical protein VF469_17735 [Kofleriaceae bacterium]
MALGGRWRWPWARLMALGSGSIHVVNVSRSQLSTFRVEALERVAVRRRQTGFRSPLSYFHNGFAADLPAVVDFYDTRFQVGFTQQEKSDLVAFLRSL